MKRVIFILLILFNGISLWGEQVIPLLEVTNPWGFIDFHKDHVYISQTHNILIYSLKDFKFIREFGKKGEGPVEFKFFPQIKIFDKYIIMKDFNKLIFFTHLGEFIEEIRKPPEAYVIAPVPGGYLCRYHKLDRNTMESKRGFYIFTKKFESKKLLMEYVDDSTKFNQTTMTTIVTIPYTPVYASKYRDKIFIGNAKKGLYLEVFNLYGDKLHEINKEYEKIKISKQYKDQYLKEQKKFKSKSQLNTKYDFRTHFPAFNNISIANENIIISLFDTKIPPTRNRRIFLDLKGNFIKEETKLIPDFILKNRAPAGGGGIYQNKGYALIKNKDNGVWELQISDIKEKR